MAEESLIFKSKDFFGDATDARLYFYRGDQLVHVTNFEDGFTAIKMPSQLEPGVYNVVARRETSEYRVDNLMISLASHYFSHSRLHDDIKLEGKNLLPGNIIEEWKFDPLIRYYVSYLPANANKIFDDMTKYSSNPDGLRWGGQIILGIKIEISKGAAVVDGTLVEWNNKAIDVPSERGTYNIGIKNKQIVVTKSAVDYKMATLLREHVDWVRMTVVSKYHPVYRDDKAYIFNNFEKESSDVDVDMHSHETVYGRVDRGKAFGRSRSSLPTTKIKVNKVGNGPVFATDRLYVYADDTYFLLWDGVTLLTALPRWEGSYVMLDWTEGIIFTSWGNDGHSRWQSEIPHLESYVRINDGATPISIEEDLQKTVIGFSEIALDDFNQWGLAYKSSTATMDWNPYVLNPQLET
jgi:hypothetical protein